MGKTSKECYTETFEGIRMFGCGMFGLLSNLVEWGYDTAKEAFRDKKAKRKEKIIDVKDCSNKEG